MDAREDAGRELAEHFRLLEKLDEDDSGELHRAIDLRDGRRAIVKILRGHGSARRERVIREAKRAAQVNHEGLARVLDVGQDGSGDAFVAWEEIEGERLSDRLARAEPITEEDAVFIAAQICHALAAAHDANVTHRELRPSVVVLVGEGDGMRAKLTELGVPAAAASSAEARYLAPEQRSGEPAGRRADVYSIGMILNAMLGGRDESAAIEGPFGAVVKRCLAEDPRDRFLDTVELDAALRVASEPPKGASSRPPRISSLPPPRKPSSRPPPAMSDPPPSSRPPAPSSRPPAALARPKSSKPPAPAARAPAAPPPRPLGRPLTERPRWEDTLLDIGDGPWPRVVVTTLAAFVIARILTSGILPFVVAVLAGLVAWFTWRRTRPGS